MKLIHQIILFLMFLTLSAAQEFKNSKLSYNFTLEDELGIWPLPQSIKHLDNAYYSLNPDKFKIVFQNGSKQCPVIQEAIQRYMKLLFEKKCLLKGQHEDNFYSRSSDSNRVHLGELDSLNIMIGYSCEEMPDSNMTEMYLMTINPELNIPAQLISTNTWGALRGLETFSQYVHIRNGQFVVPTIDILDFPRFLFRGLLLDTSRHYLPLNILYKNLDAMAYNKLNVFHWHMVDDPSFPFVSETYPSLSEKGAYSNKHVYTHQDVKKVIEYARLRGIRVMVELDTPGHTLSWGKGLPHLLTQCYDETGAILNNTFGPIDPTSNLTYTYIEKILSEVTQLFPDSYLHLGGDEVDFNCWASNPAISSFMEEMGFGKNYSKLESYYINKLIGIVNKLSKNYIVWQEVFDNQVTLDQSTIIHVWKPGNYSQEMARVTKNKYHVILSTPWYLNEISYGIDWKKYYLVDPVGFHGEDWQKWLVIGGEACMWGEYVDATNVIQRTWARANSVAERLWSSHDTNNLASASARIEKHRCRMLMRGIKAEPVMGPGYCDCDVYGSNHLNPINERQM